MKRGREGMNEEKEGRDILRVEGKGCMKRSREEMCEERREGMYEERKVRDV